MARLKTGKFSPEEENALLAIPRGQGRKTKELEKLAKKFNRVYNLVYGKWVALHNKKVGTIAVGDITPMKFESIDFVEVTSSVNKREAESMYRGLESAIKSGALSIKKALLIDRRFKSKANEYLVKTYPKNVFTFHAFPKDKKRIQVIQKS